MGKKIVLVICCILIILTSGCLDFLSSFTEDPVIRRANPYLEKITMQDPYLETYVASILNGSETEKEAVLTKIYRHIVETYTYLSDPKDTEVIQSPVETIQRGGGDCEDLSILLISLLEQRGVHSYLVLTDTHAYALAYDVDPKLLLTYVESALMQQVKKEYGENISQIYQKTLVLKGKENWYYGGNGSALAEYFDFLTISYDIDASNPLDIYLVDSIEAFHNLSNNTGFSSIKTCSHYSEKKINDSCVLYQNGGIILSNPTWKPSHVSVEINLSYTPSFYALFGDENITFYTINQTDCVVLDPTAGRFGFPGYDAGIKGEKIAINPETKEYVYLS